jgi:cell division protein FtsB
METSDGIEKLINERGSGKILLQRLEHAKDQYAVLERKVAELNTEVERLRHENKLLPASS